ncbi:MAG: hypothetical protein JRJ84_03045 [Deltaproteobacteria bacterium]|nr:hypothetical protein [Deltaproteobacteria bacterium]
MRSLLLVPLLLGCNQYDLFRVTGFQQEAFTNDADVLFVVDNSGSMVEENEALGDNFEVFISELAAEQGTATSDGLVDAVDNYIEFASRRTTFIDFHIGVTSTDAGATYGGLFGSNPVIEFGEPDVVEAFQEATDEANQIGGSGNEEGLEAVFMAMCRAAPEPPEPCFEEVNQFTEEDILSNDGLLRRNSAFVPVIVSDEGDVSRRKDGDGDDFPDEYDRLYRLFGQRMAWAVIGPQAGICNFETPVPDWTADRYRYFVDETDGIWVNIAEEDQDCAVTDFAAALQEIGELVNRLLESFPLQAVPDPETILVFVDGKEVDRAAGDGQGGFTDGWSYDADDNAVRFHGTAVPDYNAKVRIYYLPISGMPRDLPF